MIVVITEASTGKLRAEVPVLSHNVDGTAVLKEQLFEDAWRSAVEDGSVDVNERENYKFTLTQP